MMTGYSNKYGAYMTKADKKQDAIKGLKKWWELRDLTMIRLKEKVLHDEYGMSWADIEAVEDTF